MTPHSVPPSSPPGTEKANDIDMDDDVVPQNTESNGNGNGNDNAQSDENSDDNDDGVRDDRKQKPSKSNVNLEELFDAEDSDEEFSSSAAVRPANDEEVDNDEGGTALASAPTTAPGLKSSDPEVLRAYYQRLFPFRYLFQWLNHSPAPTNDFAHREFAFTLQNDAYLRYQSFPSADLLRKQCIQMTPSRFEIGPIYSTNPRDRKTLRRPAASFRPIAKELVFDIDMTDYDDIRTCCSGAAICRRCWRFITMAVKVVDVALREDFGFRHVLWVYSGRRGVHAWVCDRRARMLDDGKRRAIAGYLEVLKGGSGGGRRVNVRRPLHPHISRSLNILKQHFQSDILHDQDPWADDSKASHLLNLLQSSSSSDTNRNSSTSNSSNNINNKTLITALRKKWDSAPSRSSASKWADIDAIAPTVAQETTTGSASSANNARAQTEYTRELLDARSSIILEYTYPRLDAEVSKKQIHLLKAPFCIHPGTGRVCVPIDVGGLDSGSSSNSGNTSINEKKLDAFDPTAVPTVGALLAEIDAWDGGADGGANDEVNGAADDKADSGNANAGTTARKLADYEKTSLRPYVEYFRRFVGAVLRDEVAAGGAGSGNGSGNGGKTGRMEKRAKSGVDTSGGTDPMEF